MIDWRHWHNEPFLVGGLIFLGWLYAVLTGPLRGRLAPGVPYPARQAVMYYGALVIFYLAVGSPFDQLGERFLLSAHMVQHQLLMYPAAVLFLLGLPAWAVRPLTAARPLQTLLRLLTRPVVCGTLYVVVYSVWHAPGLYDWALQDKVVHVLEHLMFFGVALLYWWPLYSPSREFPPISYPGQMIYLVLVAIGMTPVFAFITFSHDILYPTYEFAPRLIANFSPADDQLLAGVIMKIVGMAVSLLAFGVSFYRWYQSSQRPNGPAESRHGGR
ncbi:MAG TPA: cytochrome c oxidase assembly protein [Opitutaceae bacterium]|nr:cytochrome c oxidase assembly protein [Opitutaceae bacterium]